MTTHSHSVHVSLGNRSYDVIVGDGLLDQAGEKISALALGKKAAIITDSNVEKHHAAALISSLEKAGITHTLHVIPAGEASKNMAVVATLCSELTSAEHDRKSFVIALGGGVVGDLAGFVAAIFYRGVPFVQIPTTIVSVVDSSVGGKTGVNIPEGKNLVGSFHQPRLVIVDPLTLRTLPDREYFEGFAEVIKHASIRDAKMLDDLAALNADARELPAEIIARNIAIKARIVEADEEERIGIRALLNFGHTIGHGIEASLPYGEMLHGEAISLGMKAALYLSVKHSTLTPEDAETVLALQKKFHLPLSLTENIKTETILKKLSRDKKFSSGKIRFVLLDKLGSAHLSESVTLSDIENAIESLR